MTKQTNLTSLLQDEVMSEMADSFFGARRAIDDEIDLFEAREADVALAGQRALCCCALLYSLLQGEKGAQAFFDMLPVDVAPSGLHDKVRGVRPCLFVRLPWGLTRKRRFAGLLCQVYWHVQDAFDRYLNGSGYTRSYPVQAYAPAAETTGKEPTGSSSFSAMTGTMGTIQSRTVGWKRYTAWCDEINARIEEVNRNQSPSQVLGMARSMDVAMLSQERVSGTGVDGLVPSMDKSLCLRPVACHLAGVGPLPALPPLGEVEPGIREFAMRFYEQEKDAVDKTIVRLEQRLDCTLDEQTCS
jgi:hypothetical protein